MKNEIKNIQEFTDEEILDEIDADLCYWEVPQGEIESLRQEWRNRFLILRRKTEDMGKLEVRLSFDELTDKILEYKAKSEYQQASIIILRKIFEEAEKESEF